MASELLDRLMADIKTAMRERNEGDLMALRTLHAQIKDATVNAGKDPTDEAVAAVIAKALKQLADSLSQFEAAGREDLAGKARRETELYRRYQPPQLSEADIESLVRQAMAETGAASKKEMGKVIQAVMAKAKGSAEGRMVSQIAARLLP